VLYDQQQPSRAPAQTPLGRTFNVTGQQFYSNLAPTHSANFPSPQQRTRPPVPLFHSSGNIHTSQQPHRTTMTGNPTPTANTVANTALTHNQDFVTSFDGLDGDFGDSFGWDTNATFTPVNNGTGTTSTSTVSPKDLYNDFLGSNPPSAAFTNLTSPDINASPYMAGSSTEVSPMFQDTDDLGADTSSWFPLFPESGAQTAQAPPMERHDSNMTEGSTGGDSPVVVLDEHNFRRKSSNNSPGHGRHSSISGVKPRRRKAPLPPIAVDTGDKVAVKRARNTLAARESRQRKLDHLGSLEARIKELEEREEQFKATLAQFGYTGPLMQM
jgi:hypothetical protein